MATSTNLTELNIVSLFEILDIPEADSYFATDGMGSISSVAITPYILNARTSVLEYLDSLPDSAAGEAKETRLIQRIQEWDEISGYTVEMKAGGAGNAQGLNFSFAAQQERIRQLVLRICPFYKYHDVLSRQAANGIGPGAGMFVPIARG